MIGAILALLLSAAQGGWQFIRPSGVGGPVPPLGVAMGFLPKDNKNTFNIVITMVEASPVENTARMVHEIDGLLAADPLVTNYQNWIGQAGRSEEHTSELQSLMRTSYAVFCLKKKIKQPHNNCSQQTRT